MFTKEDGSHKDPKPREANWIRRSQQNPKSLKLAIRAMCFHCMGGTEKEMPDSGWRQAISECTSFKCPLHTYRPTKMIREGVPST